jgi:Fe2+ transport system protein FeoA
MVHSRITTLTLALSLHLFFVAQLIIDNSNRSFCISPIYLQQSFRYQMSSTALLLLADVPIGRQVRLHKINSPDEAIQAIRLGLTEGETVVISSKLPNGPVVVTRGNMDIALGHSLCQAIQCELL